MAALLDGECPIYTQRHEARSRVVLPASRNAARTLC
jgi:hypothetical protein